MVSQPQAVWVVRFGVFEADLHAHELRKGGLKNQDPQPAISVSSCAPGAPRPGEIISRDGLHKRIWPADAAGPH